MNPSRLFILRPVATSLIMLAILIAGALAYRLLPISSLPEVDFPTIQVTTLYPGAGPDVMLSHVTSPLEDQLGEIAGLEDSMIARSPRVMRSSMRRCCSQLGTRKTSCHRSRSTISR